MRATGLDAHPPSDDSDAEERTSDRRKSNHIQSLVLPRLRAALTRTARRPRSSATEATPSFQQPSRSARARRRRERDIRR